MNSLIDESAIDHEVADTGDLRDQMLQLKLREHHETEKVLSQLATSNGPRNDFLRSTNPLTDVMQLIAIRMGIECDASTTSVVHHTHETEIDSVAESLGVNVRTFTLPANWWTANHGDLVVWSIKDDRPFAAIIDKGNYKLFDPIHRTMRRIDKELIDSLKPQASTIFQPLPDSIQSVFGLVRFATRNTRSSIINITVLASAGSILTLLGAYATGWLVDELIPNAERSLTIQLFLALVVIAVGQVLFQFVYGIGVLRLRTKMTVAAQSAIWDRLLNLPVSFTNRYSSGDLMNRAMMVSSISSDVGGNILRSLITGIAATLNLGLMLYLSVPLAMLAVVIGVVWSGIIALFSVAIRRISLKREQLRGKLFGNVVQLLNGIARIRISSAEQRAFNQWGKQFGQQQDLTYRIQYLESMSHLVHIALIPMSSVLLFWLAGGLVNTTENLAEQSLSLGSFLAFHASFGLFLGGCLKAGQAFVELMESGSRFQMVEPLIKEPTESSSGGITPSDIHGQVEFRSVTFRYQNNAEAALNDVNMKIKPGSFTAIVGPSGSGKSTLLRLLLGFEQPETGQIFLDHCDLAKLNLRRFRQQLGIILQTDYITVGSIRENITMGQQFSDGDVLAAVKEAGLAEDIEQMPMGLHTMVSEGGTNMSGGQRQRLRIARALIRNPQMLLVDEGTSALDNRTQAVVAKSFRRRNVTRIIVAHRLSTIRDADQIIVLDRGEIVQSGTFDELSDKEGLFKSMIDRQKVEF